MKSKTFLNSKYSVMQDENDNEVTASEPIPFSQKHNMQFIVNVKIGDGHNVHTVDYGQPGGHVIPRNRELEAQRFGHERLYVFLI